MTDAKPTIVLVHGAFADGSSWDGVIERLQREGYGVEAPAIALRGVGVDSAYLASVVKQIDGPVLLVGHSYGGALISNAATKVDNVIGLVFVAAFAPDTDEVLGDGLDQEVRTGERAEVGGPGDPAEGVFGIGGLELSALHRPADRALDPGPARGDQLLGGLHVGHVTPGPSADLDDARAHEPAAHDPDRPHVLRSHEPPPVRPNGSTEA
jgi:pimeloyl-ACP methyl ester carboxylesterase